MTDDLTQPPPPRMLVDLGGTDTMMDAGHSMIGEHAANSMYYSNESPDGEDTSVLLDSHSVSKVIAETIGNISAEDYNTELINGSLELNDQSLENFADGEILKISSEGHTQFFQVSSVDGDKQLLYINLENFVAEQPVASLDSLPILLADTDTKQTQILAIDKDSERIDDAALNGAIDIVNNQLIVDKCIASIIEKDTASEPFVLADETVVMIEKKKCLLKMDKQTNKLMAYPVINKKCATPIKNRRKMHHVNSQSSLEEFDISDMSTASLTSPYSNNDTCRRSTRTRIMARSLQDYEISADKAARENEESSAPLVKASDQLTKITKTHPLLDNLQDKTKQLHKYQMQNFLADLGLPVKRGRGRPRKRFPDNGDILPAFIIPASGNQQAIMMTPLKNVHLKSNIPELLPATRLISGEGANCNTPSVISIPEKQITLINTNCIVYPTNSLISPNATNTGGLQTGPPARATMAAGAQMLDNVELVDVVDATLVSHTDGTPIKDSLLTNQIEAVNYTEICASAMDIVNVHNTEQRKVLTDAEKTFQDKAAILSSFRCSICNHQSYYNEEYQSHLKDVHHSVINKCKCCPHLTTTKQKMLSHFKEFHPRNICPVCDFTSEYCYVLTRHSWRHKTGSCKCDICGKNYKDQYILKIHMKMVHMPPEEHYSCATCSKNFTRKAHLKRHVRTHDQIRKYKCDFCSYRGNEKADLKKHMLIHAEPKFSCDVCGKMFRHSKNLDLHMKRHKGQRDYKCGVCDFYGYTFTDIRKHIERRHATVINGNAYTKMGSQQYLSRPQCQKCCRIFKDSQSFNEHNSNECTKAPYNCVDMILFDQGVCNDEVIIDTTETTTETTTTTSVQAVDVAVMQENCPQPPPTLDRQ